MDSSAPSRLELLETGTAQASTLRLLSAFPGLTAGGSVAGRCVSDDGNVVFTSTSQIAGVDANNASDVFLLDALRHGDARQPELPAAKQERRVQRSGHQRGRQHRVAFVSTASNLMAGTDANGTQDARSPPVHRDAFAGQATPREVPTPPTEAPATISSTAKSALARGRPLSSPT
ncbi:MAG: hypothetical protein U0744_07060 [Gemmataceae bacterium]